MRRQLVLWRHGRTAWNVAGRVQGQSDIPLDDVGRDQARRAANRLATLRPHRIVSSDLQRAADTADALGRVTQVQVELDPRLREMCFGDREGMTWSEAWKAFPDGMRAWADGDETQIPHSETHRQAGDRFRAALDDLAGSLPDGGVLVVVAHGAVLRAGICAFLGLPQSTWSTFGGINNCCWTVLEEDLHHGVPRWRISEWNAGTLPEPLMSDDDPPGLGADGATR